MSDKKVEARVIDGESVYGPYWQGGTPPRGNAAPNAHSALTSSPVWAAVDLLSSDVSDIPFKVYRRRSDGGREEAVGNPVYRLLHGSVGQRGVPRATDMTSNIWLVRMMTSALLYGNAYSRIIYSERTGRPVALQFLEYHRVIPEAMNGQKFYRVTFDPELHGPLGTLWIPPQEMIHIQGLCVGEYGHLVYEGLNLISYARYALKREQGAEQYVDDFLSNSAEPSGYFETEAERDAEAEANFMAQHQQAHAGGGNRHKSMILYNGMKYNTVGVSPKDAMAVDMLNLSTLDVARYFRLQPHKLGDKSRAAFNTLEEENRSYLMSSLGGWLSRFEFECNEKLLPDPNLYAEFNRDAKLKSETITRYNAFQIALMNGIMNLNEVRAKENLNPIEGGNIHYRPANWVAIGDDQEETDQTILEPTREQQEAMRSVLSQQLQSCVRLACSSVQGRKNPDRLLASLNGFGEKQRPKLSEKLEPTIKAALSILGDAERAAADVTNELVDSILDRLVSELVAIANQDNVTDFGSAVNRSLADLEAWSHEAASDLIYGELGEWKTNEQARLN